MPGKCCDDNNSSQEISRLSDQVGQMMSSLAPFLKGHPLLFLQETSDVASFDATSGWGAGIWAGWAIANGSPYTYNGTTVQTFDMRDRVPVGAGISYIVGQAFGSATHTLTEAQLPVVAPGVNDPGHIHVVTDPGHDHGVDEDPHTHAAAAAPHAHPVTLSGGAHGHPLRLRFRIIGEAGTDFNALEADQTEPTDFTATTGDPANTDSGPHEHTGNTDSTTAIISVDPASTGIGVNSAYTGITIASATTGITVDGFGSGDPHNNLQPSSGGLWVQRISI